MEVWEEEEEELDYPHYMISNLHAYPVVVFETYRWTWRGLLARFRGEQLLEVELGPWERIAFPARPFVKVRYEPSETSTRH